MRRCEDCKYKKYKTVYHGKLRYDKCPYPWDWKCEEGTCKHYCRKWWKFGRPK